MSPDTLTASASICLCELFFAEVAPHGVACPTSHVRAAVVFLASDSTAWAFHCLTTFYRLIPLAPEAPELEAVEVLLVSSDHLLVDSFPFLFVSVHSSADFVYTD